LTRAIAKAASHQAGSFQDRNFFDQVQVRSRTSLLLIRGAIIRATINDGRTHLCLIVTGRSEVMDCSAGKELMGARISPVQLRQLNPGHLRQQILETRLSLVNNFV
jgi:hypothetical protein